DQRPHERGLASTGLAGGVLLDLLPGAGECLAGLLHGLLVAGETDGEIVDEVRGLDRGQGGRGVRCELAGALGRLGAVGLELVGPLMLLIVGTIGQSLALGTSLLSELFGLAGQGLDLWACPVRSLAQLGRRGLAGIGQDSERRLLRGIELRSQLISSWVL